MERLRLIRQRYLVNLRRGKLAQLRARYAALSWAIYNIWMVLLASILIAVTPFLQLGLDQSDNLAFALLGAILAVDFVLLCGLLTCECRRVHE